MSINHSDQNDSNATLADYSDHQRLNAEVCSVHEAERKNRT